MSKTYPTVEISEEGMREGMQIESADIPVEAKVKLLDALSETGLSRINVGSFVSPRYTPQMREIDRIVTEFTPRDGVTYYALALNEQGRQRASQYAPPLSMERRGFSLNVHLCDVFIRRNTNQSQADEIARWPGIVEAAKQAGATSAGIGLGAAWGSNFTGDFSLEQRMEMLERQHAMWDEAGIPVTRVSFADPMSWCRPHVVKAQIEAILERWPAITNFHLHLHDARGLATACTFVAIDALDERHTVGFDTTIGGIGGCPYCGNGRATGMAPTEDVVVMLEEMGIPTGVDIEKLIRAVWLLEDEVIKRPAMGHVSKAGPFPRGDKLYDANAPFVETHEQARHFLLGPSAYEGAISPWREPITSPMLDEIKAKGAAAAAGS